MVRRVFYSFHYEMDAWRAAQIRNIGVVDGNKPAHNNDWEEIKGSDERIKEWIEAQMKGRSCTIVLVGSDTANRKWINYEIKESWAQGMGVAGVSINGLKDINGRISQAGKNPFDFVNLNGRKMSEIVELYTPSGVNSEANYNVIRFKLKNLINEAIKIRGKYK